MLKFWRRSFLWGAVVALVLLGAIHAEGVLVWLIWGKHSEARYITLEGHLLLKEDLQSLFDTVAPVNIASRTNRELFGKECYLVVCAKQTDHHAVWGQLICDVDWQLACRQIDITVWRSPRAFEYQVIPMGKFVQKVNDKQPSVKLWWRHLYVEL